jgi:uncharacterized phosphosugar-binding protein
MSAKRYLNVVSELLTRLGDSEYPQIERAGDAVAHAIENGRNVWVTHTAHCVVDELTGRAGGYIAIRELKDVGDLAQGDVVLIGSPVGVAHHTVEFALQAADRGCTVVALTNVRFEQEPDTIAEHPTKKRLHEIAGITIDIGGPIGDGVFDVAELKLRAIPHSGVTLVAGLWMILSHALETMRQDGRVPRLYQCDMIEGARARNAVLVEGHRETGLGYVTDVELATVRARV